MGKRTRAVLDHLDRLVGRFDSNLKAVYGSAQIDPRQMGTQAARSASRLDGVDGGYEVRHDSAGHTYLVRSPTTDG